MAVFTGNDNPQVGAIKSDFVPPKDGGEEKFPISFWNYRYLGEGMTPDEVSVWADLGLTVSMAPKIHADLVGKEELLQYLDNAEKAGIKLILWVEGLEYNHIRSHGEQWYRDLFTRAYQTFRHPALYGFYAGDEPSGVENFRASWKAIAIQREIAPDLNPYLNLHTCMDDVAPEEFEGRTFRQWLKELAAATGFKTFSYGHYDQVWNDFGVESYYRNIKALREASDAAGVDVWVTLLSSAHYMFRIPTEYEFVWQVNVSAALGARGIVWFRLYDRPHGPNYHGSPIDEYGNKAPTYIPFLHANRRFQDHYGKLLMKLKFREAFFAKENHGGFETLPFGYHPVVKTVRATEEAVISFFNDKDGGEYMVMVNASMDTPGVFRPEFDREAHSLKEVMFNGAALVPYGLGTSEAHWDGAWLYPGQMIIYKID
ncbi:MAG: hypothetical protein IKI03_03530 [Clostridia bacterium]|nr:hypothetical protein [Clostridia bacterium]